MSFDRLPDEIVVHVMSFVGFPEVLKGPGRCSRRLKELSRDDGLWCRLFADVFPTKGTGRMLPDWLSVFKREFLRPSIGSIDECRAIFRKRVLETAQKERFALTAERIDGYFDNNLKELLEKVEPVGIFLEDGMVRANDQEMVTSIHTNREGLILQFTRHLLYAIFFTTLPRS